ncbi:MAG: zinc ribbon domain-containing protein [Myxococcota bacterium]
MTSTTSPSAVSPKSSSDAGRWLLFVEGLAGLAVVALIIGKTYGAFPTVTFALTAVAMAFTVWVGARMVSALGDPTLEVRGEVRDYERERLEGEKQLLLKGIKDLEADFATGKMDQREYDEIRVASEKRAIAIIRELKAMDERWAAEAGRLVAERLGEAPASEEAQVPSAPSPAAPPSSDLAAAHPSVFSDQRTRFERQGEDLVCSHCGFINDDDARFCAGCGRQREHS